MSLLVNLGATAPPAPSPACSAGSEPLPLPPPVVGPSLHSLFSEVETSARRDWARVCPGWGEALLTHPQALSGPFLRHALVSATAAREAPSVRGHPGSEGVRTGPREGP